MLGALHSTIIFALLCVSYKTISERSSLILLFTLFSTAINHKG